MAATPMPIPTTRHIIAMPAIPPLERPLSGDVSAAALELVATGALSDAADEMIILVQGVTPGERGCVSK